AGMFRDPQFGPVIMFGAGGIFTEALSDVAFRLAPLSSNDVEAMLDDIKVQPLLDDFRGEHKVDRQLLIHTLTGLSRLAGEHPQIAEIDINPLVTRSDGSVVAVDALVGGRTGRAGQRGYIGTACPPGGSGTDPADFLSQVHRLCGRFRPIGKMGPHPGGQHHQQRLPG
ncbi:MAG: acetate--CoA ligase family protein, partial [Deltaproteobacteria bacterium]|nr:acetate--CoA ligase family protein [Deltaproteobacteria bacterium]